MEISALNTMWILIGTTLVFFMQAGFCMLEAGFTRAKNTGNIIMKNFLDFCIGTPIFWLIGFGLMYGGANPLVGSIGGIASENAYGTSFLPNGVPFYAFLIFQIVFCATSSTIVSGAMAERTKFTAYCLYSILISMVVYPISGHWIWGGGWLSQIGFHDFAGSTAVHLVGGISALIGAKALGPRIGKYNKDGNPRALPGHSLTLAALGIFILWFCWFGFNAGSTKGFDTAELIKTASKIFVNTNLCAAMAVISAMILTKIRYKKPDVSMTLNAGLGGLVSITAACDTISPSCAVIIGFISGFITVFAIEFIDQKLRIDDPVGASGVHGANGIWGTIAVGLFSDGTGTFAKGIFIGGSSDGLHLLLVQFTGVLAVTLWVAVTMVIVFSITKHTIGLRVTEEEEVQGLDISEHGVTSYYNDYLTSSSSNFLGLKSDNFSYESAEPVSLNTSIPVQYVESSNPSSDRHKMTKICVICKQNKFEDLKAALNAIGLTGITVTQVLGCGAQKGAVNLYRGLPMDFVLLPKMKVEVIVSAIPVSSVVDAIKKSLYTGCIGDGKIFVYDVKNVIRVRTGEEGYDALQREN